MPALFTMTWSPPNSLDGEVDGLPAPVVGVGDVGRLERGGGAELGRQRLAAFGVDVGDDDAGAFLHEALDDGAARGRRRRP